MIRRKSSPDADIDQLNHRIAQLKDRMKAIRAENKSLREELRITKAQLVQEQRQKASLQARTGQIEELHQIIDKLKRENEHLRLGCGQQFNIPGNLAQIEQHVWKGMWLRSVDGGRAGAV